MSTKKTLGAKLWYILGAALLAAAVGVAAQQVEEEMDAETKARVDKFDKGPSKINVSKYPPEIKGTYKLYIEKCGKCHTVARAINCDYVLADEWERYIKRMMRRAGSFMSPEESKKIFQFAVYDSQLRHKDLYERKLKESGAKTGGS